ncbi:MAG TPA: multicopper oxidase domain-containing protein [Actinomycetota bacterium]|nr:multicopper oxidase domain-containing protein [Actinomycetota bacterium]
MEEDLSNELAQLELDEQKLTEAVPSSEVVLAPGSEFALAVRPIAKRIGEKTFRMLSYNGSIPGPTLRVKQGSEVTVRVTNETHMDTTVHWHGLRLENRYDGVPHETQRPIEPGGTYTHRLSFPDAGLFWYHPHMREDYAQEMGLYGNVIVEPTDPSYWPPADREVVLTLDDILIEDDAIASFDAHHATFTAMGRFGNVLLVGGETAPTFEAEVGKVVRLLLTNTANTRVFRVAVADARMKLVGGDGGRYERETRVDQVVVAPSERAIVDVSFASAGRFALQHVTPERTYELGWFEVGGAAMASALPGSEDLRLNEDMVSERERVTRHLDAAPDKTLALVAEMDFDEPEAGTQVVYVCPMHPEVTNDVPASCPKCGMKLMPTVAVPSIRAGEGADDDHAHHGHSTSEGIEWEDDMVEMNRMTTPANMRWKLVDRDTGKENADIDWLFHAGDQVKIRLVNEMESDHPMHHPFHVHGERFLVLARNEVPEDNLVWKDTVLLRTGEIVDILLDASNPGLWMAHCHIAEHMESGMMFNFRVVPSGDGTGR